MRRDLLESSTIAQLGGGLRTVRDTLAVTKETVAGIIPTCRLERGNGVEGVHTPRPTEADRLAADHAVTTNSRKDLQKLGKLDNQDRYDARTALLGIVPEPARLTGPNHPLAGRATRGLH